MHVIELPRSPPANMLQLADGAVNTASSQKRHTKRKETTPVPDPKMRVMELPWSCDADMKQFADGAVGTTSSH